MEYWEDDNPDSFVRAHISYHPADLTKHEAIAFRAIEPLLKKHGNSFCYDPCSPIWENFYEQFKEEFIKESPKLFNLFFMVSKDSWKILGINTFATKVLTTDRERREWQYRIWGVTNRPVDMLAIVITEHFPQLIEDLDMNVSPYFFKYKNFLEEIDKEKSALYEIVRNDVKNALASETNNDAILEYFNECHSRILAEYNKQLLERKEESERKKEELFRDYTSQLKNWFCKLSLCDESGNPPKFIISKFHKWITDSYFNRSFNAETNTCGWCSTIGTHSLSQFLNRPKSQSGLWAWPMTDSFNFLYFKPEDFKFEYPAWLPDIPPYPSEKLYETNLRKHFEKQLEAYLSTVREEFKTYESKTKSTPAKLEERIEWLIHRIAFNEKYDYLAAKYKKSVSTIKEGIDNAAAILNIRSLQTTDQT